MQKLSLGWTIPELERLSSGDTVIIGEELILLHTLQQMGRLTICNEGKGSLNADAIVDTFDSEFCLRVKPTYIEELFTNLERECLEYSALLKYRVYLGSEVPRINFNSLSSDQESYDPRCYERQAPSPFMANPDSFYDTWSNTLERSKGKRHIKLTGAWVPESSWLYPHRVTQFETQQGNRLGFVQRKDAMEILMF